MNLQIEPDILPSSLEIVAKVVQTIRDQREIRRKKRIFEYAERIGNIDNACRYFGVATWARDLDESPQISHANLRSNTNSVGLGMHDGQAWPPRVDTH